MNLCNDVGALCEYFFKDDSNNPIKITSYQKDIISTILYRKHKRVLCTASTRAGKSLAVALAIILLAVLNEGRRIRIIAPTKDHTKIIMSYVIQHLLDNVLIKSELMFDKNLGVDRLKKELTKERIKFRNNSEIAILTANINNEGRSLVGYGGTDIVLDECELIPKEIIQTKVMRMLGDSPDACIFLISNPATRGFMYDKWMEQGKIWKKIHIPWQKVVSEGRLSQEYIDEQRENMTINDFKIWYDSFWLEEEEDTILKDSWIKNALDLDFTLHRAESSVFMGVDPARFGRDYAVITITIKHMDGRIEVKDTFSYDKSSTDFLVSKVLEKDNKYKCNKILIDEAGVGGGVVDFLKKSHIKHKISGVQFGGNQGMNYLEKKRYLNSKTCMIFRLADLFEKGLINLPHNTRLIRELLSWKCEYTSNNKTKSVDPEKSPDFADSMLLSCNLIGANRSIFKVV